MCREGKYADSDEVCNLQHSVRNLKVSSQTTTLFATSGFCRIWQQKHCFVLLGGNEQKRGTSQIKKLFLRFEMIVRKDSINREYNFLPYIVVTSSIHVLNKPPALVCLRWSTNDKEYHNLKQDMDTLKMRRL